MTYFYLFETKDYVYCGQHRITNDKDPIKDSYKGSGKKWISYLKENGWWLIKDFRNNVKKTILEVVMDDENRQVIGNVEKYWIEWSRETYGNKCINISKGSRPNSVYANAEEAKQAEKESIKEYYENNKERRNSQSLKWYNDNKEKAKNLNKIWMTNHKEEKKSYDKKYYDFHIEEKRLYSREYRLNHIEEKRLYQNKYVEEHKEELKRKDKINIYIKRNGIVTDLSKLPKKWSEEDIAYYKTRIY